MAGEWWDAKPAGEAEVLKPKRPRGWADKFREAFRGVKLGVRGQSSFFVHFFFAMGAVAGAFALDCGLIEWCLVILCVGLVLAAELFNSAIEALFHGLDSDTKKRIKGCLDIAAGAVLVVSITAAVVGTLVLGNRLLHMLHFWQE